MIPLVPLLLEQFVGEDGIDLSIIDDCLRARPAANRCVFGRSKGFSTSNWLKQHPLSLIAAANYAPVYDHDVVKICVDLKFQLFGNFLYLLILSAQIIYVFLYTSVALASPTPTQSYYDTSNYTCKQLCHLLISDSRDPLPGNVVLRKIDMEFQRNREIYLFRNFTVFIIVFFMFGIVERIFTITKFT